MGSDRAAKDGARELAPQYLLALFGDESLLGETGLPDGLLEAHAVELTARRLEAGIGGDAFGDLGVGHLETQVADLLVEHDLGDQLGDHLAVDPERTRLIHRELPAELAAELLQAVIVNLAELLDRDLGMANLGDGRTPKAAEHVADAPDRETEHEKAHHGGHDDLADPVGRGFAETSKHAPTVL